MSWAPTMALRDFKHQKSPSKRANLQIDQKPGFSALRGYKVTESGQFVLSGQTLCLSLSAPSTVLGVE